MVERIILFSFFLIASFTVSIVDASGQKKELMFKQINTNLGLSNNKVRCIIQDSDGYLWFGTEEGLNKYDGYDITIFKRKLSDTTSLPDNYIQKLFVDSHKQLWIGTDNGLCLYNKEIESFTTYVPNRTKVNINTVNRVTGIHENAKNKIYITTEIGMLYMLGDEKLLLQKDFQQYGSIRDFIIDKAGNFWIGSSKGLIYYDILKDRVTPISSYYENGIKKEFTRTVSIFEDGDTVWFGTNSDQLAYIPKKSMSAKVLKFIDTPISFFSKVLRDESGLLYVAAKEGLFILNKQNHLVNRYDYQQNNPNGISSSTVHDVYIDKQGNLWLATAQGINVAMHGKSFKNYNFYSQQIKLDVKNVQAITFDSKGNLWLGSYDKGLNIINIASGRRKLFMPNHKNPYSVGEGSVMNIFEDSKKNMWIGTYLGYLQRFDPTSEEFISYSFNHLSNGLREVKDIRSMVEDKAGNLWFISHGFGLFKFNPQSNKYKFFVRDSNLLYQSLADNFAFQLVIENDSILWIATASGLTRFNIISESFESFYNDPADSSSISNNLVNTVFCDSGGNIWIGTSFGLNLFNPGNNTFYHLYEKNGLPSNQIKSIVEEAPGIIWMGTGYGLSRMVYKMDYDNGILTTKFRNFNRSDNLQDVFFYPNSAVRSKTNEIFFGTENGVVAFLPGDITNNTQPPDVFITEFQLFNKKVQVGDPDSLIYRSIVKQQKIRLKYQQNFFTFKYVAINFVSPENNQYAYKMEGFDKDWNYVGNKREATYTNLAPGKYTFKVKASNNDGIWNDTGTSVDIIVLPPWWKKWWFQIIIYMAVISLLFLLYYLWVSFYRKQRKILQILVRQRTLQLEEVALKLEEKQEEINSQNEELMAQRDELENANETLIDQKQKILDQNYELDKHRNRLEFIVEERTKELIEAKDKAEESDKLKSSFLANLSHEIRTPLNAILGFSLLLGEKGTTDNEREEYNALIHNSSNTLLDLINDILDISRMESGQMELSLNPVHLESVVNDLVGIFNVLIKRQDVGSDKPIFFKVNIHENLLSARFITDKRRLEQIFSNLISNALKFTKEGYIEIGCIRLPEAEMLEFYVKDTGIGIKEENLKLIFERFRKVEEDKSQLHRGTGLGLAICFQLANMLGGTMYVTSKICEGSVFYFTIPLKESDEAIVPPKLIGQPANHLPELKNCDILVAEDDISNFNYIEKLLKKSNAHVIHAVNGQEVLNILQTNHDVKLILMDIKMPVMDGLEALREIRKRHIKIPVIAQTAYALADEVLKLRNEGFDEYISKPINPKEFYQKINQCLKID
jgi:signal transduction histidine kinase/ligand-binding sensor domain-containing protein